MPTWLAPSEKIRMFFGVMACLRQQSLAQRLKQGFRLIDSFQNFDITLHLGERSFPERPRFSFLPGPSRREADSRSPSSLRKCSRAIGSGKITHSLRRSLELVIRFSPTFLTTASMTLGVTSFLLTPVHDLKLAAVDGNAGLRHRSILRHNSTNCAQTFLIAGQAGPSADQLEVVPDPRFSSTCFRRLSATQRPSLISRQFPRSPMLVFEGRVKHGLDVPVDRPHDADAREQRWPVLFCDQQ
jgi:hypothetical protein